MLDILASSCCLCSMMMSVLKIVSALVFIWIGIKIYDVFYAVPPMPNLPKDQYWGPKNDAAKVDESVRPFKVSFTTEMVADLKDRLRRTRYTEPLEDVEFQYGFNSKALKPIVEFWMNKYDFVERENYLNQFPQFLTQIQGLDIHFIHVKPDVPANIRVLPMLILHGWPGSVREFYRIIPMLTTPVQGRDFVFELIVPSLPGFGFSQASSKVGLGPFQMGVIMDNLMERIGYSKYYIQGGDWGGIITSSMATLLPDKIIGFHTNFGVLLSPRSIFKGFLGSLWPSMVVEKKLEHLLMSGKKLADLVEETGYFHLQATKPDTVGVGISDSPASLAAYILEKFSTATNPAFKKRADGGLTEKYTFTDLIDNLMIYWASNSATTAVRIYTEYMTAKNRALKVDLIPTRVPTAVARFPLEITYSTDWQLKDKYPNLVQASNLPRGGHFAALEEPQLLADDIFSAVVKFEEFHRKRD